MAGCYGNSAEDKYFESMCDKYTDEHETQYCQCEHLIETDEEGEDWITIDQEKKILSELYDSDREVIICPECDCEIEEI